MRLFNQRTRTLLVGVLAAVMTISTTGVALSDGNVDLPRFPSISPDGKHIVFSWRGDLWKVDVDGGHAIRITTHPGNETRSAWSADGKRIAFNSTRDGFTNIHLMNADGTDVRQVTNIDRSCILSGFGEDESGEEVILLNGVIEGDVYRSERPYMIDVDGGEMRRVHDAFGSQPSMSPNGDNIAFVRGGYYSGFERRHSRGPETMDVWMFDRKKEAFKQLTEFDGNDGQPKWASDRDIIFISDRELERVNLYRMTARRGGDSAKRITSLKDRDVNHFDVDAKGDTVVFSAWDALYTLDLDRSNAKPKRLTINANEDERDNYEIKSMAREVEEAALSPDGQVIAYVAYGEIYVRNVDDRSPSRRVTNDHARERDVTWSPDGLKLFFSSDRDGTESIYSAAVTLTRSEVKELFEEITNPKSDEEEEESAEKEDDADDDKDDAKKKKEEKKEDDGVSGTWTGTAILPDGTEATFSMTLDLSDDDSVSGDLSSEAMSGPLSGTYNRTAKQLELEFRPADSPPVTFTLKLDGDSATGKVNALGMIIEIEAERTAPAVDESSDEDVDEDDEEEKEVPKEYDPKRWHDAMKFEVTPVVQTEANDRRPKFSPDGKYLTFNRSRGDLILLNLETGDERTLYEHWDFWMDWSWSPDSKLIAYSTYDLDFNSDVFIIPADGSWDAINITPHPDNDSSPQWSADGKILSFVSDRVNDSADIWMVYLEKDLEALTTNELTEYYEVRAKAAKKREPAKVEVPEEESEDEDEDEDQEDSKETEAEDALELELDDAWRRVRRVTTWDGGEGNLAMTPAGDRYVFTGNYGGSGLFSIKWDGSDRKRLTGPVGVQHMSLTGDKVVFVSGGRAGTVPPGGGEVKYYDLDDQIRIDLQKQASQKFLEAARGLGERFYHPDMKDLEWGELTERYHELAKNTRTVSEFNDVCARFLGELSASHLGVRSRGAYSSPNQQSHGRLGAKYQRVELGDDAYGYEVTSIVPQSPAALGPMALQVGDVITEIELEPFGEHDTVISMLEGRVGEETLITVRREFESEDDADVDRPDGPQDLQVLLTPVSYFQIRQLEYLDWREENARKVAEMSDGRLGYIHIQGMNQPSLDVFERDLFAAAHDKDGLIIDVRNNGGGWTTDRLLSSIMVQPHAYTIPRGADPEAVGHYPQDRLFIARYSLPINTLCNEKSFSNAEIFSHAFKTLERGTLVGEQTWGGVISTGGFSLIDGTTVRLPFRGWYLLDGTDMENNGAMPDIRVPQTPSAEAAGKDEQLETAVEDLLKRLD